MKNRVVTRRIFWTALITAVLVILPQLITASYYQDVLILALLYAVVASNWDLTIGYVGIFNFAHVTFFALGAYTSGILTTTFPVSPWLGICAGMAVAVLAAMAVAILATRLRGIYVALTTFAFSELVLVLIMSRPSLTGGPTGLVLVPSITIGSYDFAVHPTAYVYLAEMLLVISTVALRLLVRSDFGLGFVAVRDFEEYASSRGVAVPRQRLLAIMISAVFTSAAGAIYAHYLTVVSPDILGFSTVTLLLSMVILGGAGTVYGPIVAAIALTFVTGIRQIAGLGDIRFMAISVLTVLVLLFARGGIWMGLLAIRKAIKSITIHSNRGVATEG